jgi:signal transduction histidine kinase
LELIVVSARDLIGSTGAMLAVLSPDRRLLHLLHVGIGDIPGLCPHHAQAPPSNGTATAMWTPQIHGPPLHEVPIHGRTGQVAHLYVTGGLRGEELRIDEERLLLIFAATAAAAIDATLLNDTTTRRLEWKRASARITTALLSETDSGDVLRMVMAEGRRLVDADDVLITRPDDDSEETLEALATIVGRGATWTHEMQPLTGTVTEYVCRSGAIVTPDLAGEPRVPIAHLHHPNVGPLMAVPLTGGATTTGVLMVTRRRGRRAFTAEDETTIAHFAEHVALALELVRVRAAAERAHLDKERDRIARDMHDHVIGRLFGTGMAMQALQRWISDPAGHRHLAAQTDNLDAAIRDLRTLIYGLDRDPRDVWSLSARIQQVMDETTGHLGFAPTLTMDPGLDLPPGSATPHNLLAVLREALTNVARHAHADAVHITVTGGTSITMTVADDGRGLGQQPRVTTAAGGHGLANIADRASTLGGSSTLSANPGAGLTLRWSAPMMSISDA